MTQELCALIRSMRLQSFCMRRLGISLLMGLVVLWPAAVPGETGTLYSRLPVQVRRLWERDLPLVLRSAGVIHQPPEYVAQQALAALDRHDLIGIMRFVDHSAPSAHQQVSETLHRWPLLPCVNQGCGDVSDRISTSPGLHRSPKGECAMFLSHSRALARRMN